MIIVDDGSIDDTVRLARDASTKVKVLVSPRLTGEGWGDQRTKGSQVASGDWLLHADMDMRLGPRLAREIPKAVSDPEKSAYRFRLMHFLLQRRLRFGASGRWNEPWLVRRGAAVWERPLHERLRVLEPRKRIGQLAGRMWHINDSTWEARINKGLAYARFEADLMVKSGKRVGFADLFLRPLWVFFKGYGLLLGFLDGRMGLLHSLQSSWVVRTAAVLAWEKQNQRDRASLESEYRRIRQERLAGERPPVDSSGITSE